MVRDIEDTVHPVDAASVLALLKDRPQILALGEPTHGAHALLDGRNALFRQLVEDHGFRTIALETDCLAGQVVDDYVTTGRGDLDDVMARGLSHEWGAFPGNRELVRWMRAHNARADDAGLPASERLRFAGFDGPLEISAAASPRAALVGLHDYLAARVDGALLPCTADALDRMIGPDDAWTEPAAMMDPSRSVGQSAEARELRLVADDLAALLDTHAPQLLDASSQDEWERARLYGRTATGLLRYHFWMADPSPARMTRLLGARDAMMAANLLALADRGPVLVNAHNSHLRRTRSTMTMWDHPRLEWWGAGALVSRRLGDRYAFLATAVGTLRHQGVDVPPSDTVEGVLHGLGQDRLLVDAPLLAALLAEDTPVGTALAARVSPWFGYAPLDLADLAEADALVFVRDVPQP
ncbi:erythromycin esterase family protein [Promicromonospora sukumoe]|uniref:Erythromycin esterase-like protein n=1 Tax=Promicromonospora sukumoe TaxID=88382 RepID=A0A7W3J880_9MICO|nr:erythromycin esterase family protein [Promicromonospora sukumoe]MBA8808055.1 erythromycin esterase-like protein [Promicromonospora sukumoe]